MSKKYLFIADVQNNRELTDKVVNAFRKKAFLTDSILFFLAEKDEETFNYFGLFPCLTPCRSCNIQVILKGQIPPEVLMKNADYYIVSDVVDEFDYINLAIQNDVEIIGTVEDEDEIFSDIEIPVEVQNLKNNFYIACKNFFDKFPPSEYEYFLFHNGLGESLGFFYWLKEYKKTHHKKILLFCWSDSHIDLMNSSPYVGGVVKIQNLLFDYIQIYFSEDYRVRNFYTLHLSENVLKAAKNRPRYLKDAGILTSAKNFLGINPTVEFEKYNISIPPERIANANRIFDELGLIRGKTIFFITEGYSQAKPNINFFIRLAEILKNFGYEIITNGNKESISGCKNIFLPLLETSVFIGLCGNVVSCLTGFNETICALNSTDKIKLSVIAAGKNDKNSRNFIMNWQQFENIKYSGTRRKKNTLDGYKYFLSCLFSNNIEYTVYQPGGDLITEEDDILIREIVSNIISN